MSWTAFPWKAGDYPLYSFGSCIHIFLWYLCLINAHYILCSQNSQWHVQTRKHRQHTQTTFTDLAPVGTLPASRNLLHFQLNFFVCVKFSPKKIHMVLDCIWFILLNLSTSSSLILWQMTGFILSLWPNLLHWTYRRYVLCSFTCWRCLGCAHHKGCKLQNSVHAGHASICPVLLQLCFCSAVPDCM